MPPRHSIVAHQTGTMDVPTQHRPMVAYSHGFAVICNAMFKSDDVVCVYAELYKEPASDDAPEWRLVVYLSCRPHVVRLSQVALGGVDPREAVRGYSGAAATPVGGSFSFSFGGFDTTCRTVDPDTGAVTATQGSVCPKVETPEPTDAAPKKMRGRTRPIRFTPPTCDSERDDATDE